MSTTMQRPVTPLKHHGSSANMFHYGEAGPERGGRVWCSVVVNTIEKVDGVIRLRRLPTYSFAVYRHGEGEVARFMYAPKCRPNPIALSERTVTRLVREALS